MAHRHGRGSRAEWACETATKRAGARPTLHRSQPAQLRSARAARLPLLLPEALVSVLPDEPIVLPVGHTFMMTDRRVHAAIMRALDPAPA